MGFKCVVLVLGALTFAHVGSADEPKQPNAAEMLEAYAKAMSGGGQLWTGYGNYVSALGNQATGQGNYLRGAAEVIRAKGEYIRMVAEARLAYARANLVEAEAAYKWEQVRQLRLMVDRLERELNVLKREEYQANKQIKRIEQYTRSLSIVVRGKTTPGVFQAMRGLLQNHIPLSTTTAVMMVPFPSIDAANFIPNSTTEEHDFPGGNLGQLWYFLEKHKYSLEPWAEAHIAILLGLQALTESIDLEIKQLQEYKAGLRKGLYDIWNPPGLPGSKPSGLN